MSRHDLLLEIQVYQHRLLHSMTYTTPAGGMPDLEEWRAVMDRQCAIETEAREKLKGLFHELEK